MTMFASAANPAGRTTYDTVSGEGQRWRVGGVLPDAVAAAGTGLGQVVVAGAAAEEAALVPGLQVLAVPTLGALLIGMRGDAPDVAPAVEELAGGSTASLYQAS